MGHIHLDRSFRNSQHEGDFFVFQTLRQEAQEITLPAGERHPVAGQKPVSQSLFDPKLTRRNSLETRVLLRESWSRPRAPDPPMPTENSFRDFVAAIAG